MKLRQFAVYKILSGLNPLSVIRAERRVAHFLSDPMIKSREGRDRDPCCDATEFGA